jgi:hypothetical protein
MARFRPHGSKSKGAPKKSARGLIPCLVILIGGALVIFFLFYELMNSGK